MRITIVALVACIAMAASVVAQTGVAGQKFAWDQAAPDLASAQGYTYKHYDDGGSGVAFVAAAVVCAGTVSPFQCETLIPAFTPGQHTLKLSATNISGESPLSTTFTFTFVVTPGAPANLHIK